MSGGFLDSLQLTRITRNTANKAVWAVTLFGKWRAVRNKQCLGGVSNCDMYINVPFTQMNAEQFNCSIPRFLCKVQAQDGNVYQPQTLSLPKFLDMQGRVEKFLSDAKYKTLQDTLDTLMKERNRGGISTE